MSQGFIVGKGGGQGKGPVKKGTIVVTYPSGSVCTVTNGSKTYTALDTSGAAAFVVDIGTWTVTVSDGVNSESKTAVIDREGQFVSIAIDFYLIYDKGVIYKPLNIYRGKGSVNEFSFHSSGYIAMAGSSDGQDFSESVLTELVDITKYSKLNVISESIDSWNNLFSFYEISVFNTPTPTLTTAAVASKGVNNDPANNNVTLSLDISVLTGSYYIGVAKRHYWDRNSIAGKIHKIWLE